MHENEVWQIFASNGEPILGSGWDAALDNPEVSGSDKIVGAAMVFLYRHGENGLELLWQKRSEEVTFPGAFDISAAGHINLGESPVEATIREAREEIGADITAEDLCAVMVRMVNRNRFAWLYLVDFTGREENFRFDDQEVSEVRWVPFFKTEEFRMKYAKPSLREDDLTFECVKDWFLQHGDL